ncbi:uncharacterized protein LOC101861103 [Aplysia californica]|uniref:Uncharacterized protein LOC101861103 n=1 Tax=Aplysia californica TaxID=6500 RepID=A0ABM1VP90_APLCA|nr:uncharacterized protein LOC101861103 [Aplysia californica]XP_035824232.1 uncharacterized protein LOC101861103 [Aplysia californica]
MRTLHVIVVAVFMAGLAFAQDEERDCHQQLYGCIMPLYMKLRPHIQSEESAIAFIQSTPVDALCTILESFRECALTTINTVCSGSETNLVEEMANELNVIAYTCSPVGRPVFAMMQQSVCLRDSSSFHTLRGILETCQDVPYATVEPHLEQSSLQGTLPDPAVVCPQVAQMRSCIVGGVGQLCGDAFEEFFTQLWTISSTSFVGEYDCGEGLRRATAFRKRGLSHLLAL